MENGKRKLNIAFVILHFRLYEVTKICVESILRMMNYNKEYRFHIIIVDNGSDNESGKKLQELYANNSSISVILNDINVGFARGNNIGYKIAKEEHSADYIVITNNDTEFIQNEFVELLVKDYFDYKYYVLGPDILNLEGVHQSPQRDHIITYREIYLWYIKRVLYTRYLRLRKRFNVRLKIIDNYYIRKENSRISGFTSNKLQENVELQGACLIFSPQFVEENGFAFQELAFMYTEEAALAYRCGKNGWKIMYDPRLKIKHAEKSSTNTLEEFNVDKDLFYSEHNEKSLKALLDSIRSCT